MSLNRLNAIVMSGVLPFNFGMNYEDCLAFYDKHKDEFSELCPTDPRTWDEQTVAQVNQRAKEQTELCDRLMALPQDEFNAELDKLAKDD